MNDLQIKAAVAGIFFGAWPLFMQRSRLEGNLSSAAFALIAFVFIFPFAFGGSRSVAGVDWKMVIIAGISGGVGLLFFNSMLAGATKENVGLLFVTVTVVQTTIPVIQYIVANGTIAPSKAVGLALAFVAAILLTR